MSGQGQSRDQASGHANGKVKVQARGEAKGSAWVLGKMNSMGWIEERGSIGQVLELDTKKGAAQWTAPT